MKLNNPRLHFIFIIFSIIVLSAIIFIVGKFNAFDSQTSLVFFSSVYTATDKCPNIKGKQTGLPANHVFDENRNCVKSDQLVFYNKAINRVYHDDVLVIENGTPVASSTVSIRPKAVFTLVMSPRLVTSYISQEDADKQALIQALDSGSYSVVVNSNVCSNFPNVDGIPKKYKLTENGDCVPLAKGEKIFYNKTINELSTAGLKKERLYVGARTISSSISQVDADIRARRLIEDSIILFRSVIAKEVGGETIGTSLADLPPELATAISNVVVTQAFLTVLDDASTSVAFNFMQKANILESLASYFENLMSPKEVNAATGSPSTTTNFYEVGFPAELADLFEYRLGHSVCLSKFNSDEVIKDFIEKYGSEMEKVIDQLVRDVTLFKTHLDLVTADGYINLAKNGDIWLKNKMEAEGITEDLYQFSYEYEVLVNAIKWAEDGKKKGGSIPIPAGIIIHGIINGVDLAKWGVDLKIPSLRESVTTALLKSSFGGVIQDFILDKDNNQCVTYDEILKYVFNIESPYPQYARQWVYPRLKFLELLKEKNGKDCKCGGVEYFKYEGTGTLYNSMDCSGTPVPITDEILKQFNPSAYLYYAQQGRKIEMVDKVEADIYGGPMMSPSGDEVSFPGVIVKDSTNEFFPYYIYWFKYNNTTNTWHNSGQGGFYGTIEEAKVAAIIHRPTINYIPSWPQSSLGADKVSCSGYDFVVTKCVPLESNREIPIPYSYVGQHIIPDGKYSWMTYIYRGGSLEGGACNYFPPK